jgi:threonine synthase
MAKELGIRKLAIASAGNAAGAMAAYAAHAGLKSCIFMPEDTPRANVREAEMFGAQVTLVRGLITDCGKIVAERKEGEGWFDVSTLKEPYRIEGKKTMGYELAGAIHLCGRIEGLFLCPEGAACFPALRRLIKEGWISAEEKIVLFNTASGLKYLDVLG